LIYFSFFVFTKYVNERLFLNINYGIHILLLRCEFELRSWQGVLDITLCDTVCQWLPTGWWFSPGTRVSSTNKIDRHDIADILLKVALNTIILLKNTPTEIHRTQEKNKKNKKHNTTFVGHHYTQANTNNVNKTWIK
jgi:hypothetical protein